MKFTINLVYLCIPFLAYSIYALLFGLWNWYKSIGTPDIGPTLGIGICFLYTWKAIISGSISWLIYLAFRTK